MNILIAKADERGPEMVRMDKGFGLGEQLYSFLKFGPVWDGDLISKQARTDLVAYGLAGRREGYNFLTSNGVELCRLAGWLSNG